MFPVKNEYPRFVPDQLLTSEHLNQLFEYLEEQGRLTRTNLIGIGIVCGLEVKAAADGTSITITKGCGVTSEGYLVSVPEVTYQQYKLFNAEKERYYDRFVNMATKKQRFPLFELMQEGVEEGTVPFTKAFLQDKVVLIFVELLEEGNKNCNPNSCDDKGINVSVNFRPLLISKANAAKLIGAQGDPGLPQPLDYVTLPELRMRRWDVPAGNMLDTADLFIAYRQLLSKTFLAKTEQDLSTMYQLLRPLVLDEYPANPFNGLAAKFSFLYKNTINANQLVQLQYYYDLFSDLLLAYDELRIKGMEVFSLCCPDSGFFPRHLLLGEALSQANNSDYRHYFIPSPILCCGHERLLGDLRELFKRLVLLVGNFFIPPVPAAPKEQDEGIRITPSKFGDRMLSEKSIPFYYQVKAGTDHLYRHWSMERNATQSAHRILSYHAVQYNNTDDFVRQPLLYDLEPYNFLRIEGHVGKPFPHVLKNILRQKDQYRLPIEVIALSADIRALNSGPDTGFRCHFQDIESLYDALIAELKCELCKQMKYYYDLPSDNQQLPYPTNRKPTVTLLQQCDPAFLFTPFTIGHEFEVFYQGIRSQPYMRPQQFYALILKGGNLNSFVATPAAGAALDINDVLKGLLFGIIYYIEELSKTLAPNLSTFDYDDFSTRFDDLQQVANLLRAFLRTNIDTIYLNASMREDVIDHLDELILACRQSQFQSIITDYRNRLQYVNMLRKFGYFIKKHPGVQHKAGVPIGGTFIIVYHERTFTNNVVIPPVFSATRREAETAENRDALSRSSARNTAAGRAAGSTFAATANISAVNTAAAAPVQDPPVSLQLEEVEKEFAAQLRARIPDIFLEELIADIPNGTVVADFYLPYICCSDCPPIQYILNDITERPQISLENRTYCSSDDSTYTFTLSPEYGQLEATGDAGDSIGQDDAGNYIFRPWMVPMGGQASKELTFTYSYNGLSASFTVTVYQQPDASFTVAPATAPLAMQFTNTSDFGEAFLWNFGDGTPAVTEENPLHTFSATGAYLVTLQVTNGPCVATVEQHITVQTVGAAIPPGVFCSDDTTEHPFVVTPLGGNVAGEGVTAKPDGTFVLVPASVVLGGAPNKELTFTYTVPGHPAPATTRAMVHQRPLAAFEFEVASRDRGVTVVRFINHSSEFATKYFWEFENGATSAERTPPDYTSKEDFKVVLTVWNGPCETKIEETIPVGGSEDKTCLPLGELLARFDTFRQNRTEIFAKFRDAFGPYETVENFFANLATIQGDIEKQRQLFKDADITGLLLKSIEELYRIITDMQELATPALALFRILTELTIYIACVQEDDVDKGLTPPLIEVLDMITSHLSDLKPEQIEKDKATLLALLAALNEELQRLADSGEENTKPLYKERLTKLIEVLKNLLQV